MKFNRKNVRKALEEMERCGVNASSTSLDAEIVSSTCARLIAALCPDKPAPKVYTEAELEPVGTVPVIGDKVVLRSSISDPLDEVVTITGDHQNEGWFTSDSSGRAPYKPLFQKGINRILKRPLRDVFRDPRVGDVVGKENRLTHTVKYVDGDLVAFWSSGGFYNADSRTIFASRADQGFEVIHRAESK